MKRLLDELKRNENVILENVFYGKIYGKVKPYKILLKN